MREAAAAEAAEADKGDDHEVDKDDSKQAKPEPKWATHSSRKNLPSKRIEPPDDNLDEYFGLSQGQNSQGTADITPTETPKKSEEAKLKNNPDGSSCRRVNRSPQGSAGEGSSGLSTNLKQPAQHHEGSSCRKVHRSPQDSAGEGSPGPSSQSKQSAWQAVKSV